MAKKLKLSLKKQMIISFSVAFSLIIVIFINLILNYNINIFRDQSFDYCSKIVESNIILFDNYFEQMQNILRIIANDSRVIEAVSYRNNADKIDYALELYHQRNIADILKQAQVVGNIDTTLIIGDDYKSLYYYGNSPKKDYDFSKESWFMDAIGNNGASVHFTDYHYKDYLITDTGSQTVSIITTIVNTVHYMPSNKSYLMCDFKLEPIILSEAASKNIEIAIYDNSTPIYFTRGQMSDEQFKLLSENLANKSHSFILPKTTGSQYSYVVVNESSRISGWTIIGIMPVPEIDTMRTATTTFSIAMIVLSIAIVITLSLVISKSILVPMNTLVDKFNSIAAGETNVIFEPTRSEEVNILAQTAHNMLANIDRLTQEAIKNNKLLIQEQFKVLQHQINPHFFNNMLQSIKAMAVEGNTAAISRTTTLLGKILSYAVYNPLDRVKLSQELNYIGSYIDLHKIRYSKIGYSIDCPPELSNVSVPKLIIQPIIENSIEHGFSDTMAGYIRISVEEDNEDIHIIVTDNGIGFEENKLSEIKEKLAGQSSDTVTTSIGIMNVHFRIQNIYGTGYGISILSRKNTSTSIIITIPHESQV